MRILSGRWAGRDLVSPGGRVRPTAEALRGLWLDELTPELDEARVLDLFAGTGALGLEALSRGARRCDFVENGSPALHALKANIATFRARNHTRIFRKDVLGFLSGAELEAYDICLADPPYTSSLAGRLVAIWSERPFARILAVEHAATEVLPRVAGTHQRRIEQDGSAVTIYRRR